MSLPTKFDGNHSKIFHLFNECCAQENIGGIKVWQIATDKIKDE